MPVWTEAETASMMAMASSRPGGIRRSAAGCWPRHVTRYLCGPFPGSGPCRFDVENHQVSNLSFILGNYHSWYKKYPDLVQLLSLNLPKCKGEKNVGASMCPHLVLKQRMPLKAITIHLQQTRRLCRLRLWACPGSQSNSTWRRSPPPEPVHSAMGHKAIATAGGTCKPKGCEFWRKPQPCIRRKRSHFLDPEDCGA